MNLTDYESYLNDLLEGINEDYRNWTSGWDNSTRSRENFKEGLSVKPGRKFDKVISNRSVWGFVAKKDGFHKGLPFKEGDVFKPAGWAAAAKHVRGSIYDTNTDWYAWTGPNYLI